MGTGILAAATNTVVLAASYTKAITSLKSVLLTLGSAIGAVMLVYGGIKFAIQDYCEANRLDDPLS